MAAWETDFALEPDLLPLAPGYVERLDDLLPRGRAWSNYQEAWGEEDSDRIDVWKDPRGATEVRCRLDARKLDPAWVTRFLDFVRWTGRHLHTPDGRRVEGGQPSHIL
jgi:hypothetical protein